MIDKLFNQSDLEKITADLEQEKAARKTPADDAAEPDRVAREFQAAADDMLASIEAQHGTQYRVMVELMVFISSMRSTMDGLVLVSGVPATTKALASAAFSASAGRAMTVVGSHLGITPDKDGRSIMEWATRISDIHDKGVAAITDHVKRQR